ncbi:Endoribonuclease L-PSP/chorismate mutase-like protein, partial [Exophiala viscosa]|uniref:Endoribonuclease L-PSP/chorismate mutase-like protein n=1 Tax=Exophiala viscosa TaxID=2486360 RepID=UPI002190B9E9
ISRHGIRCFNPHDLQQVSEDYQISQAIVIPANVATVVTSGQCGFKGDGSLEQDPQKQIILAFSNAEKALQAVGVEDGWKSVYNMTTYCPSFDDTFLALFMPVRAKYLGTNRPAWTGVAVSGLADGAVLEMTLYAAILPKST